MNAVFDTLYRAHYSRLYTLAFRMTGTPENAEDVLQTSFMDAYRAFDAFRYESTPYTWLYRMVRRKEQEAVERYTEEMSHLLAVDRLYGTELSNRDYEGSRLDSRRCVRTERYLPCGLPDIRRI